MDGLRYQRWKAGFVLVFTSGISFSQSGPISKTQPNILWITIEDTSPQFIGCYGNKDARTPVIDRLAKGGVRFTNAFSTGTVSSPSRSTIITGIRTFEMGTGHHRSEIPVPDFIHGFPSYLKKAGYYTSNNAKEDYNVANRIEFSKDAWNESSNQAGWWKRKQGQPFFAVFNFMDSHQSRTMTLPDEQYEKMVLDNLKADEIIHEDEFAMPPFYHDTPEMRKQHARLYNSIKLTDNRIGEILKRLDQDNLTDSTIIFFYADHGEGIPRGKMNGINLGYRVPFVIWIPPMYKHLSPWGTGGVVTDELIDFEDLAPTLICLAGGMVPDYLKGRILMGNKRSKPVDMLFLSNDRADNGPDMVRSLTNGRYVYSRNFLPFMPEYRYIRYGTISPIFKLMQADLADGKLNEFQKRGFEDRPAEFLFDIEKDKWESRNLINDAGLQPMLKKMRAALYENMLRSKDVMLLPEYEMNLIPANTTPYEYRLNEERYQIKQILEVADLSGKRGKDFATRQAELLKSTDKIVRYWAIIGLRSQNSDVLKPFQAEITKSMKDSYPPVIITASAISYKEFNNVIAEENLRKYIGSDNQDLALMATNYLMYVNNKEPFINAVKSALENEHLKMKDHKERPYFLASAFQDFLGSLGLVPNTMEYER